MELHEIIEKLKGLETRANELLSKAESEPADAKAFRETLENEVMPEIKRLQEARAEAERQEEMKAMRSSVTSLEAVLEEMRKPIGPFHIGRTDGKSAEEDNPYVAGKASFYNDIKLANKGRQDAIERLEAVGSAGEKAMTEGAIGGHTNAGQYLVQPAVERQIVEAKELDNVMRALCSKLTVNTNEIRLDQITLGTTAGWVAELATKPEGTSISMASIAATVFTAAGLATISNQLLADSNPAVDRLVTSDLAKRLVALEEAAFINGTGTGQPLGLIATPGLLTQDAGPAGDPAASGALLDAILDAIGQVQTEHGEPTAILMHPRTWTRIIKSRDAQGTYWLGGNRPDEGPVTSKTLFGYRVVTSNRVPTNMGVGANESRVVVGDYSEALILDREGIAVDESPHVYFTSNQTVFRAEMRVGFTAARQPKAFCVVGGPGLAAG